MTAATGSAEEGTLATVRRGLALSPELRPGLAGTLGAGRWSRWPAGSPCRSPSSRASTAASARPGGPDLRRRRAGSWRCTLAALVVSTACGYLMTRRLFTVSETALAGLRARTFRHIHDLSMLHQQSERRGSLVSRVTSDVDQITQFLQTGGVMLLLASGQLVVTTVVMLVYSWQLTLVVFARVRARPSS